MSFSQARCALLGGFGKRLTTSVGARKQAGVPAAPEIRAASGALESRTVHLSALAQRAPHVVAKVTFAKLLHKKDTGLKAGAVKHSVAPSW